MLRKFRSLLKNVYNWCILSVCDSNVSLNISCKFILLPYSVIHVAECLKLIRRCVQCHSCCRVFEAHPALCDAVVELMGLVSKDLNEKPATAVRRTFCCFLKLSMSSCHLL